ncbi:cytochrome p450 monooxygenase [Sporothrix schenckii 1099-18]|uniref:Cytochrome P450 n=2 Tax=Sporothrix schenckii TaxID=29908 RepID=U7Q0H9_SPOS1|nr:cytochrome p450 monooxygenase [Sporothrix schenckii 1099-18]ERT00236.1 hypothetical protein HMPREF1624_03607 [Sporothrix schenckii ATCC 58251]KJR85304.1 cytochrome p450 monooxygenase [Sporothrix schenckii 1099-18]
MATNTSTGQHPVAAAASLSTASCFTSLAGASSPSNLVSTAVCFVSFFVTHVVESLTALAARLTVARIIAAVAAFLVAAFLADCALKPRYPRSLPRVGYGDSVIATLRNWFGYIFYFNDWVDEGYNKFSKQNKAFLVPSAASRPQEVVVPRNQTAWMLDLPDHVLSAHAAHGDVLYTEHNFIFDAHAHARAYATKHGLPPVPPRGPGDHHDHKHSPVDEDFHTRVVHRSLARHLPGLLPAVENEVIVAVDAAFGGGDATAAAAAGDGDGEWHTIKLWDAWLAMVPQITNLLLVGPDACRNQPLLDTFVKFADTVVTNSFLLNMFPKLLHPLVGRLASIPNRRLWRRAHGFLEPLILERIRVMTSPETNEARDTVNEDFITWHIRMALAENRRAELDPVAISKRLLPIEFAAIHTTVLTGFFVIIDLLTSDPAYIEGIREEVQAARDTSLDNHWTKPSLARLWRTDSAIRESMRVSNFATSLVKRKVIAPGGVTNAAEGWHVPYGGLLMLDLAGTHHDPDLYTNPDQYDAFRYARQREAYDAATVAAPAGAGGEQETTKTPEQIAADAMRGLKLGMVTTSDSHLAFGHGRHACPGRFFVAHELKMILAHLLTNFEFKPLETKPKNIWIGQTIIPPVDVKVEVRRRKAT